jgi:hypothetical protein
MHTVLIFVFPSQQCLGEHVTIVRYTSIVYIVPVSYRKGKFICRIHNKIKSESLQIYTTATAAPAVCTTDFSGFHSKPNSQYFPIT